MTRVPEIDVAPQLSAPVTTSLFGNKGFADDEVVRMGSDGGWCPHEKAKGGPGDGCIQRVTDAKTQGEFVYKPRTPEAMRGLESGLDQMSPHSLRRNQPHQRHDLGLWGSELCDTIPVVNPLSSWYFVRGHLGH